MPNPPYLDTFVIVNRFRMHYYHSGTEAPINVVMLHSSLSPADSHLPLFPHFVSAGFRCFAPDAIGFGESDTPDRPSLHTFDFHSDNLAPFIRELDLHNLVLIGHEWGGLLALDYAISRPDNTLALALVDSGVFLPNHNPGFRGLLHRSPLADILIRRLNRNLGQPKPTESLNGHEGSPSPTPQSPATRLGFLRMYARANLGYDALRMKVLRNSLPKLRTPTVLVRSNGPQTFSEAESRFLQQNLPYVRSHTLPTTNPQAEHSDLLANRILDFLSPLTTSLPSSQPRSPA